ncbi:MAG: hypothetical protein RSC43_08035, partial [Clostridia bacterium]
CDGEAVSEEMLRELYIEYGGLGAIWRAITKKDYSSGVLATEISKATGEPLARVLVANDVFCELGLIAYRRDGIRLFIMPNHISEKVNLADSKIICKIKEALGALANKG